MVANVESGMSNVPAGHVLPGGTVKGGREAMG